ncbi:hypothetical protein Pelo_146 [Pelomyxa schiedti]|nr:hypothetical protein Pelo_146 [Pelomyxa schiedti]
MSGPPVTGPTTSTSTTTSTSGAAERGSAAGAGAGAVVRFPCARSVVVVVRGSGHEEGGGNSLLRGGRPGHGGRQESAARRRPQQQQRQQEQEGGAEGESEGGGDGGDSEREREEGDGGAEGGEDDRGAGAVVAGMSVTTCIAQAALEYCRIAWDLFPPPSHKVAVVTVYQKGATWTLDWKTQNQSISKLTELWANIPPADPPPGSIYEAITISVSALAEDAASTKAEACESSQCEECHSSYYSGRGGSMSDCMAVDHNSSTDNSWSHRKGPCTEMKFRQSRIVVLLPEQINMEEQWEKIVTHAEKEMSRLHSHSSTHGTSHKINLDIIRVSKRGSSPPCKLPSTSHVTCVMFSVTKADLHHFIEQRAIENYGLEVATITQVPTSERKPETKTLPPVKLLYHSFPHLDLAQGSLELQFVPLGRKILPNSLGSSCIHRITPCHVWSQEAVSIVSHVLSGKALLLKNRSETREAVPATHALIGNSGVICLHCLSAIPQDTFSAVSLPSYTLQPNLYRVREFLELIDSNMLCHASSGDKKVDPLSKIKTSGGANAYTSTPLNVERSTRYWPWLLADTILFGADQHEELKKLLDPLKCAILRATLQESEAESTRELITRLFQHAKNNESKLFPHLRTAQTARRDAFYKLWAEVYLFITKCDNSDTTTYHQGMLRHMESLWPEPIRGKQAHPGESNHIAESPEELPAHSSATGSNAQEDTAAVLEAASAYRREEELAREKERQTAVSLANSDIPAPPHPTPPNAAQPNQAPPHPRYHQAAPAPPVQQQQLIRQPQPQVQQKPQEQPPPDLVSPPQQQQQPQQQQRPMSQAESIALMQREAMMPATIQYTAPTTQQLNPPNPKRRRNDPLATTRTQAQRKRQQRD